MHTFFSSQFTELYLRLFIAMGLGMIIGLERIWAHKTAGMRTYSLVAMGAALFSIVSQLIYNLYPNPDFSFVYIPAAVITGVGFLGTGLMVWKDNNQLIGLTSATGLWICAGIGLSVGYGFFEIGVMATILTIFVFTIIWFVEQWIKKIVPDDRK